MCTTIRRYGRIHTRAQSMQFEALSGNITGRWGINGQVANARMENLQTTWKDLYEKNRGILYVDSFLEKGHEFKVDKPIAVIYSSTPMYPTFKPLIEFAIITTDSTGEVVKYHHRMPLIINDVVAWLKDGRIVTQAYPEAV